MKKVKISLILCLLLISIFVFTACGNDSPENTDTNAPTVETVEDLKYFFTKNVNAILENNDLSQAEKTIYVNAQVLSKKELITKVAQIDAQSKGIYDILNAFQYDVESIWSKVVTTATAQSDNDKLQFVPGILYSDHPEELKSTLSSYVTTNNLDNASKDNYVFLDVNQTNYTLVENTKKTTDGLVLDKDNTILFSGKDAKGEVNIPSTVKTIKAGAFSGNKNVTTVNIPSTVDNIEKDAFTNCDNLKINADIETKPEGWDDNFTDNDSNITYKPGEIVNHEFGEWTEIRMPTNEAPGRYEATCTKCGEKQIKEVAFGDPISEKILASNKINYYKITLGEQEFTYFSGHEVDGVINHPTTGYSDWITIAPASDYPGVQYRLDNDNTIIEFKQIPGTIENIHGNKFCNKNDTQEQQILDMIDALKNAKSFQTTEVMPGDDSTPLDVVNRVYMPHVLMSTWERDGELIAFMYELYGSEKYISSENNEGYIEEASVIGLDKEKRNIFSSMSMDYMLEEMAKTKKLTGSFIGRGNREYVFKVELHEDYMKFDIGGKGFDGSDTYYISHLDSAVCSNPPTCKNIVIEQPHQWGKWEEVRMPTNEAPGVFETTCKRCGKKQVREIGFGNPIKVDILNNNKISQYMISIDNQEFYYFSGVEIDGKLTHPATGFGDWVTFIPASDYPGLQYRVDANKTIIEFKQVPGNIDNIKGNNFCKENDTEEQKVISMIDALKNARSLQTTEVSDVRGDHHAVYRVYMPHMLMTAWYTNDKLESYMYEIYGTEQELYYLDGEAYFDEPGVIGLEDEKELIISNICFDDILKKMAQDHKTQGSYSDRAHNVYTYNVEIHEDYVKIDTTNSTTHTTDTNYISHLDSAVCSNPPDATFTIFEP